MDRKTIDVVYPDGTKSVVSNDILDVLIAMARIRRFRRSEGWVDVDVPCAGGRLRNYGTAEHYPGPERRAPWPRERH
jgi:hypothetical protein